MKKFLLLSCIGLAFLSAVETPFDAGRAFLFLETQVAIGPRVPGTDAHRECRDRIIAECKAYADTVIIQAFDAYRPFTRDTVRAWNIIARYDPGKGKGVMLSTHWDTRPFADLDPLFPEKPVPGANDGASGTAVLLELLPHIRAFSGGRQIDVVFWDAEDMGIAGTGAYFCQGSEHYAKNPLLPLPAEGILIDMIGDADLEILIEKNSLKYAPNLVNKVWDLARELGYGDVFKRKTGPEVFDDHVPLNEIASIPTINLIDFHYKSYGRNLWHTVSDLPAYCSPGSLKIIGDLLLNYLLQSQKY
jgi:glutaminyl-peptide cyclotransferase